MRTRSKDVRDTYHAPTIGALFREINRDRGRPKGRGRVPGAALIRRHAKKFSPKPDFHYVEVDYQI